MADASRGAVRVETERIAVIDRISPRRLMEGGAAMLAAENRNHHMVIEGRRVRRPLVRNILRVLVVS